MKNYSRNLFCMCIFFFFKVSAVAAVLVLGEAPLVGDKDLNRARKDASYVSQDSIEKAVKSYGCVKIAIEKQPPDCKQNRAGFWFCRAVVNARCESVQKKEITKLRGHDKQGTAEENSQRKIVKVDSKTSEDRELSLAERFAQAEQMDIARKAALESKFQALDSGAINRVSATDISKRPETLEASSRIRPVGSKNFGEALEQADGIRRERERQAAILSAKMDALRRERETAKAWCEETKFTQQSCLKSKCGNEPSQEVCDQYAKEEPVEKPSDKGKAASSEPVRYSMYFNSGPKCLSYKSNPDHSSWQSCMQNNYLCLQGRPITDIGKCTESRVNRLIGY